MNIISFFTRRLHFKVIDSTSSYLKRNYAHFKNMTFVSSDYQTAGRGRITRSWVSDKSANLLFSFLIKDKTLVEKFDSLSILSAVCVKKALNKIGVRHVFIKWPNDVYIDDSKVCGILLDGITEYNSLVGVIIGIGINVNQIDFPNDLIHKATSIKNHMGRDININHLKKILYKEIKKEFSDINNSNYLHVARTCNYLKDKQVYAEIDNEKKLITVKDIDNDNSLVVEVDNQILHLKTGEITFHL